MYSAQSDQGLFCMPSEPMDLVGLMYCKDNDINPDKAFSSPKNIGIFVTSPQKHVVGTH